MNIQSNLVIRIILVTLKLFLNAKCNNMSCSIIETEFHLSHSRKANEAPLEGGDSRVSIKEFEIFQLLNNFILIF